MVVWTVYARAREEALLLFLYRSLSLSLFRFLFHARAHPTWPRWWFDVQVLVNQVPMCGKTPRWCSKK
jgi:hypothetical protein